MNRTDVPSPVHTVHTVHTNPHRPQGQFRMSIKHLERVLALSQQMREYTGDADAYGVIADWCADW
jgi:hypothetical protein